jgi:hypothetical protein
MCGISSFIIPPASTGENYEFGYYMFIIPTSNDDVQMGDWLVGLSLRLLLATAFL